MTKTYVALGEPTDLEPQPVMPPFLRGLSFGLSLFAPDSTTSSLAVSTKSTSSSGGGVLLASVVGGFVCCVSDIFPILHRKACRGLQRITRLPGTQDTCGWIGSNGLHTLHGRSGRTAVHALPVLARCRPCRSSRTPWPEQGSRLFAPRSAPPQMRGWLEWQLRSAPLHPAAMPPPPGPSRHLLRRPTRSRSLAESRPG